MGQHAWVLEVRPGCEEEYKKRHDEIWPEMLDALKKAGMRNYTIFRHGLTLFGYFETDDLEKTVAALAQRSRQRPLEPGDGAPDEDRDR